MRRVNSFTVVPRSAPDEELLRRLLDASASLWNQLNYERRQNFTDPATDRSVWETEDYRKQYVGVLGSATAQQVIRKNDSAWKSFFALAEAGEDNGLPGYWGNEEDGRELRTYIRNDQYTLRWSDRSTIELTVGSDLKDEYDMGTRERLTLEVRGRPKWSGDQGRLEIYDDEVSDQYRAIQPVTVDDSRQDTPLADESAALDIGANNLVACTTTTGRQYLYEGRALFKRFRETTQHIADLQSKLKREEGRYMSKRIRRLYRRRTRRRDHAMDALARDLFERLYAQGVATVYVGDLTDVLETHWSVTANAKTHSFWAFRAFIDRLACTAEEFGITVEVRTEAWTSQMCPPCESTETTTRHRDTLTCPCGFEGHADLTASETFLRRHAEDVLRPMARPVCLTWDDHRWSASPRAHRPSEVHTYPQVTAEGSA
ncbi:MAG: transposase [Natrialbaceae archaeon]|nr:transposase [Natrialbaceae archaeon]